jgi:membrane protein YqaA with SNARE-associated domain
MTEYLLIFASAFLAATIVPFYSEIIVATELVSNPQDWFLIWMIASFGNTLGAAVNWALGRYLLHFQQRKWFPFKPDQLKRSQKWFQKYGIWSLLLAWAPVGGDALTFIAGVMRVKFLIFFILTFIGKSARYLFVILFTHQVMI